MNNTVNNNKNGFRRVIDRLNDPVARKVFTKKLFIVIGSFLRAFLLLGLCFVILLPIIEKVTQAIRHPLDLSNPQVVFIPSQFAIVNFQIAGEMLSFRESFVNSIVLSTITTIIQVIASAIAGYAFARLKFKGNNIIFYIVLFTIIVPNEALDRSRSWIMNENTFFGIPLMGNVLSMYILAAFGQGIRSAIFIFLFRQFFKGIPIELEESAQVDGAGVIRTFWSVMLPNARGAIVTVALFAFVWQWNDCYFGQLLGYSSGNMPLLAVQLSTGTEMLRVIISTWVAAGNEYLESFMGSGVTATPEFTGLIANTAALMIMAPLLIGYFFVQKLFVESIERTGLVG